MFTTHLVAAQRKINAAQNQQIIQPYDKNSQIKRFTQYQPQLQGIISNSVTQSVEQPAQHADTQKLQQDINDIKQLLSNTVQTKTISAPTPLLPTQQTAPEQVDVNKFVEQINMLQTQNNDQQEVIIQLQRQVQTLTSENAQLQAQMSQLKASNGTADGGRDGKQKQPNGIPYWPIENTPNTQRTLEQPNSYQQEQASQLEQRDLVFNQESSIPLDRLSNLYAAFGSCVSRQVKNLSGDRPSERIYEHFYSIASQVFKQYGALQPGPSGESIRAIAQTVDRIAEGVETDYAFLPTFELNDRLVNVFETAFGAGSLDLRLASNQRRLQDMNVLFMVICVLCCQHRCQVIKYDVLSGTLQQFKEVYGAQINSDAFRDDSKAYVLLPQWYGDGIVIPAYVRLAQGAM